MNPRTDLDSLPILDNPDDFVAHAYAAFILILSDVATNNLNFYSTIFLVSQIASLPCVELSYALVC